MLVSLSCSDSRFAPIYFSPGLNVVLSERTELEAGKKTVNGTGKTTLLKIIDFCLGAELGRLELPAELLAGWVFSLVMDIRGARLKVSRTIGDSDYVQLEGELEGSGLLQERGDASAERRLKVKEWCDFLGQALFGYDGKAKDSPKPTWRSLSRFFVRRSDDAFSEKNGAFRPLSEFKTAHIEVFNSYLLGLNWMLTARRRCLQDEIKHIKERRKRIQEDWGSEGKLKADLAVFKNKIASESEALANFKVHPQYARLEKDADDYTLRLHQNENRILFLQRKLDNCRKSISQELAEADRLDVERMYKEAGIVLPDTVSRSIAAARAFADGVVRYRSDFLKGEVAEIERELARYNQENQELRDKRAELVAVLKTHGALEEYAKLGEQLTALQQRQSELHSRVTELEKAAGEIRAKEAESAEVKERLLADERSSRESVDVAVQLFNRATEVLYEQQGRLLVNLEDDGRYTFDIDIERDGSGGIGKMKVFCYDITNVECWAERGMMDFVLHDSAVFEGVDDRQIAHALEYAAQRGEDKNFQYICCINENSVPRQDFREDFNFESHVRLKLSDRSVEGRLLKLSF